MSPANRLAQLSAPRRALVRLFQSINFGQVMGVVIENGEPIFQPPPTVLYDLKLDSEESTRPEAALDDFALRAEVRKLMKYLDTLQDGKLARIEVRSGIPRRVLIERSLTTIL